MNAWMRSIWCAAVLSLVWTTLSAAEESQSSDGSQQTVTQSAAIKWGIERGGMRCAIELVYGKTQVAADQPIWVRCRTRKVSEDQAEIVARGASVYTFTVSDQDGQPVPKTRYGTPRSFRPSSGTMTQQWKVDREETMRIHLNRLFDMTRAGTYTVSFSRQLVLPDGSTVNVQSESLTVEVSDTETYVIEKGK